MQRVAKFITAVFGLIATVANANIFTGKTEEILMLVISGVTALGVYAVPNRRVVTTTTNPPLNQ